MIKNSLKTINLYSYKGGVGRTLLVSQTARILAALGKKVVIADFDFDAPGLPLLFDIDVCNVKGGLYNLVFDEVYDADIEEKPVFAEALKKYLIDVDDVKMRGDAETGSIQVLPCGCVCSAYWRNIFQIEWLELLSSGSKKSFIHIIKSELKKALSDMDIDYLILDARAGVTYYSSIARHLADAEAMIFCPNEEAKFSLEKILLPLVVDSVDMYAKQHRKLAFVVSRMPPEFYDQKQEKLDEFLELLKPRLPSRVFGKASLLTLGSDMETQFDSQIRIFDERYKKGNDKQIEPIILLHEEILMVVAALCEELVSDVNVGDEKNANERLKIQAHALWKRIYGYDFEITREHRLFTFDSGEMFNPDDKNRNIAFKVKTFINLLSYFRATLKDEFKNDAKKARVVMDTALLKAGEQCGVDFGVSLKEAFGNKKEFLNDADKIKQWCLFDTRAGFGILEYTTNNELVVKNLFLHSPDSDENSYIKFFDGYAKGVLEKLLDKELDETDKPFVGSINGNEIVYKLAFK